MTKVELVRNISAKTGIERIVVAMALEAFMDTVKKKVIAGEEISLRGFGSFMVKHRAQKTGRRLNDNTTLIIPAHDVPFFKPSEEFTDKVKNRSVKKK